MESQKKNARSIPSARSDPAEEITTSERREVHPVQICDLPSECGCGNTRICHSRIRTTAVAADIKASINSS
ncbi:hypothetical protein LINPERPRIM_LOCUS12429 [Linum perenne]